MHNFKKEWKVYCAIILVSFSQINSFTGIKSTYALFSDKVTVPMNFSATTTFPVKTTTPQAIRMPVGTTTSQAITLPEISPVTTMTSQVINLRETLLVALTTTVKPTVCLLEVRLSCASMRPRHQAVHGQSPTVPLSKSAKPLQTSYAIQYSDFRKITISEGIALISHGINEGELYA